MGTVVSTAFDFVTKFCDTNIARLNLLLAGYERFLNGKSQEKTVGIQFSFEIYSRYYVQKKKKKNKKKGERERERRQELEYLTSTRHRVHHVSVILREKDSLCGSPARSNIQVLPVCRILSITVSR